MRVVGDIDAPVLVVCDCPSRDNWNQGKPMTGMVMQRFAAEAKSIGFHKEDFAFVFPSPPMPKSTAGSDKREADFLAEHRDDLMDTLRKCDPELIITLGKQATRQVAGRAVQITKVRGKFQDYPDVDVPVLPLLSPQHVLRRPELSEVFASDMHMLAVLDEHEWDVEKVALNASEQDYQWCFDLQFLLDMVEEKGKLVLGVDTETTGTRWYDPDVVVLTCQISWAEGKAVSVPLDWNYHPDLTRRGRVKLIQQLRDLLEDPRVILAGHNSKFDHHMLSKLDITPHWWELDTLLMAFLVDENMQDKSQDECIRRWVPDMAGYADDFNARTDKSNMRAVPLDDMLEYGCGDADAVRRLAQVLYKLARRDKRNWNCYQKVILPTMDAFQNVVEPEGISVDVDQLEELQAALDIREMNEYEDLIRQVPPAIRRKHLDAGKELKFSRGDFIRDILFTRQGFNLTPRVFTKSTMNLPDDEKVASTSAKDHLPYFDEEPFVVQLMDYQRLQKMRGTYVGQPALYDEDTGEELDEATGFFKYILEGKIHPSFLLHRTVTGRSSSADPNAQNFPKRGRGSMKEVVKAFRRVFRAPPGWKIIEADLSQIELRIAAWMANETTMINLYRDGADIHAATAARTMGLSIEEFNKLDSDTRDMKRFQAKAVNFGFLYGMWWRKFKVYAKTDYGIEITDEEAQHLRETFFELYPMLEEWHKDVRAYVNENGYVRALHGAVRHLPSIKSYDEAIRKECERQAVNSPVQRFASDLGLMGLHRLSRDCPLDLMKPIAFIHDALIVLVREDYQQEGMEACRFYMESTPLYEWFNIRPPMPIIADASIGDNLADMEEVKVGNEAPEWWDEDADYDMAA